MRVWLVLLLTICNCTQVIAGVTIKQSSIVLEQTDNSATWRQGEIDGINAWVENLPRQLRYADMPIRLYKQHEEWSPHQASQQQISLSDSSGLNLRRSLVHALLHVFAERIGVNDDPNWRAISGWGGRMAPLMLSADNQDVRAYASRLGMQSPQEDFVTVAEAYLLPQDGLVEDSIKCRLEKKYHYVRNQFPGYQSAFDRAGLRCQPIDSGFLDDLQFISPVTGELIDIGPVNADTVSGFELLYATPGTSDAAEIAGHLLLRVKLDNNPEAQAQGYENPKDLVISFLADTEPQQNKLTGDNSANPLPAICETGLFESPKPQEAGFIPMVQSVWQALKGLSGGFLTVMDRQTLGQTVKHYTLDEDRNLLRFALKLDSQQKQALLDYLYQAKKNYKSEYYFFSNNCASVLVKIIGKGIGDDDITQFNPWVSPPNALVALFLRHQLAQPVYPSFYSFRQQGQIAQDGLRQYYQHLREKYVKLNWPDISDVFQSDDARRRQVIERLDAFSGRHSEIQTPLWQLSHLIHQADLTYSYRDQACQQITPQSTAAIRRWQQHLGIRRGTKDFSPLQYTAYASRERHSFSQGVPHTKLLSLRMASHYASDTLGSYGGLQLGTSFMQQEMGSMGNIAMQRSSAVDLGSFDASLARNAVGELKLQDWRMTALSVRKFKQRLDRVPGFFTDAGKMGIGLSVLRLASDKRAELTHGGVLGAEALFNLYSSRDNVDYAFLSAGLEWHRHIERGVDDSAVMAPLAVETLNTWLPNRRLQWRNRGEWSAGLGSQFDPEWRVNSRLSYRLPGQKSMALVYLSAERRHWSEFAGDHASFNIGLEWNRF